MALEAGVGRGRVTGALLPFWRDFLPLPLCSSTSSLSPESPVSSVWSPSSGRHHVCLLVYHSGYVCVRVACTHKCVYVPCSLLLCRDPTPGSQPCLLQPQCLSLREEMLLAAHSIWSAGSQLSWPLGLFAALTEPALASGSDSWDSSGNSRMEPCL